MTRSKDTTQTLRGQIAGDLRRRIASGKLSPGQQLPTIAVLCQQYEVSAITIRAVLAELSAAGYVQSRRGAGSYVRGASGTPSLSAQKVVALLVGSWEAPLFASIIQGAEEQCHREGYRLLLSSSRYDVEREAEHLNELAQQVAGLIVVPVCSDANREIYAALMARKVPLVFVDSNIAGIEAPLVTTDNRRGGDEATRHLIERGHRELFVLSGKHHTSLQERLQGYRDALESAGIAFDAAKIRACDENEASAYHMTRELLPRLKQSAPCGLFALTDRIASGAYMALKESGLRIPDDVAVVGFDDIGAANMEPALSSVRQEPREMGAAAARLLFDCIRFGVQGPPRTVVLPPQLVVRASSDPSRALSPAQHFALLQKASPAASNQRTPGVEATFA